MSRTTSKTPVDLSNWDPEDPERWDSRFAWRTLWITTYNLILAFAVWFLVSAVAPRLNSIGYDLSDGQLYWLVAIPGLAGGFMRMIYMFLPPIVGTSVAKEWLLTAREVTAPELLAAGWLNHLVADDQVVPKSLEIASMIAANWQRGTEATKQLVNDGVGRTLHDAQRAETVRLATDLRPMLAGELFAGFLGKSRT